MAPLKTPFWCPWAKVGVLGGRPPPPWLTVIFCCMSFLLADISRQSFLKHKWPYNNFQCYSFFFISLLLADMTMLMAFQDWKRRIKAMK